MGTGRLESYGPRLKVALPSFFQGLEIKPALLHGDLWKGNVGKTMMDRVSSED